MTPMNETERRDLREICEDRWQELGAVADFDASGAAEQVGKIRLRRDCGPRRLCRR
jgi:hypothetical protein